MPEKFEQYFTQKKKEEEPKLPPEKHKKVVNYLKELKAILDKKNPTREDVKRAEEIIRVIERILEGYPTKMEIIKDKNED